MPEARSVSLERAVRLFQVVDLLAEKERTRRHLLQALKIDIRTFYRDLELLRDCGIQVILLSRCYRLVTPAARALDALPFPDPGLSLGEAEVLAKGRTKVHKRFRELLATITRGRIAGK
jgi:predicted DNA-binding transcriptional regulator YafY